MFRLFAKICFLFIFILASCGVSYCEPLKAAIDPTDMGVGSRPFGLGRAYSAMADDCNSVFLNPSGLAFTRDWQMTSMYSNLIGEINYTLLGFSFPFSREAVGIGYVGVNVGDSQIVSHRDPSTGRIVPTGEGAIGYLTSAILLSYGGTVRRLINLDALDDVYWGATFKIFNQELRGGESVEALASGAEMDVGFQWKAMPWLKFGAFGQNILAPSSGGVLRWTSGIEEDIPFCWKAGFAAKLVGWDAPWQIYDNEAYLSYDSETSLKRPGLSHVGLEVWPAEYLAVRLGIDQDAVYVEEGIGVDNNLTAGIGFYWNGIEFDYAFHQFGALSENNTHFFSFSLGITREKRPEPKKEAPLKTKFIDAIYPSTEIIVFEDRVNISGEVEPEVSFVMIGDVTSEASGGRFGISVPVPRLGKTPLKLEAYKNGGRLLEAAKIKVLRLPSFLDVPENYWARTPISFIAALSFALGYPDGTFRPEGNITRAELTTMIIRSEEGQLPLVTEKKLFKDMTGDHWAAQFIKEGISKGVVKGYPDGTFRPGNNINRAEGIAVIARFDGVEEPKMIYEKPFPDMPARHWAIGIVSGAKEKGLLKFLEGGNLNPGKSLTRSEAAEIISRASFAKKKIGELLDWSTGY